MSMSRNYAAGLVVLDVSAPSMFQVPSLYSLPLTQSACAETFTVHS